MRKIKRSICFATQILAALVVGSHSFASAQTFTVTPPSPGCQLLSAPAGTTPAFCDTFDKPEGIGDRSGALNGTVWGVSRVLGNTNTGQGQYYDVSPTAIQLCGTTYSVIDPNDVQICDGQLVEAQFDQTGVTSLAMYPKQLFDISGGRTGTIAFDVSNDSHGGHSVWPELWYVDKPVPTPFVHDTSLISVPANGFGVRFALTCPANSGGCGARNFCPEYPQSVPVVTVDAAWLINNYVETEADAFPNPAPAPGAPTVTPVDCVQGSSGPGNMNHFELRVSQNEIDVYGIDAGATGPLKKIAIISNAGLTIATGLVFMEDNHYNANKTSNGQGTHTFTWDNFAFDGPILPRDLAFDVLDRLTPVGGGYPGLLNTGWGFGGFDQSPLPPPLTLTVPGVYNVADATAAFLTFNFIDFNYANLQSPNPFISYSVNNGATQLAPFPFGACGTQNGGPACSSDYTIAVPVNLSDLVTGTNTITLTATDGAAIANVDLILHGAGGIPCTTGCPATLPSPTITITPSASSITNAQGLSVAVSVAGSGSPVPTGTVTLSEVGFISAPITLGSGKATITIPAGSLPAGPDLLTVSYSGDSNYAFTSNNSSVNVSSVAPVAGNASLDLSPSAYPSITTAQPLQLVVDLYGSGFLAPIVVTGTVTVTGGGYNSGAIPLSAGLATISIPAGALAVGNDTFSVNYSGDSNYAADDYTNQLTITVTGTGTTPPAKTTPTVLVTPSSTSVTTALPLTVAVAVAGSGTTGQVPTGTVTLSGGGLSAQTVTLNGTGAASFTLPAGSLTVGTDTLTVSYSGDTNYNTASGTAMVTVTATTTPPTKTTPTAMVTPSSSSITTAQPLTVAVSVSGSGTSASVATGTVTLSGGGLTAQTMTLNGAGVASFTIAAGSLTVGTDTLTISFSGDTNYNTARSTAMVTVTTTPPTMTTPTVMVTPSSSSITTAQPLTVAVVVAGSGTSAPVPTGMVTLSGGGITAQTMTLGSSGGASFTIAAGSLAVGTDTLTVSYSGDSNYTVAGKTSTITVTTPPPPPTEMFTITGTAVSVAAGATAGNNSVITVTATPSCSCSVILTASVTSSPAGATSGPGGAQIQPVLSFGSTSPVSLLSSNTGTATLTIYTVPPGSSIQASVNEKTPWLPMGGAALACMLLVGIPGRRRTWQRMLGMVLLLVALSAGVLGCTAPLSGGTAPGTYTITVTGVSGATTDTGTITLNVQ